MGRPRKSVVGVVESPKPPPPQPPPISMAIVISPSPTPKPPKRPPVQSIITTRRAKAKLLQQQEIQNKIVRLPPRAQPKVDVVAPQPKPPPPPPPQPSPPSPPPVSQPVEVQLPSAISTTTKRGYTKKAIPPRTISTRKSRSSLKNEVGHHLHNTQPIQNIFPNI